MITIKNDFYIRNTRFGLEIEFTGITRAKAARVIEGHFNSAAVHVGGTYDAYVVRDQNDRIWKIVSDASIECEARGESASRLYAVEFVTPICSYEDIETIQELVRKFRSAGGCTNSSTGIHVHIDASKHDAKTLRNFVNIIAAKEELLYKALNIAISRERYCKRMDLSFLDNINNNRPKTLEELNRIWYRGSDGSSTHYHPSRYHFLNLHSVFYRGTIEVRGFNSTLHAGKVKTAIQLCLAINNQAMIQKSAQHTKTVSTNEKYTFRTWLLRLGLIGDEFKTARMFLLENLEGNIAWKSPEQAEAQKQRFAEKARQAALQSQQNETEEVNTDNEQEERDSWDITM